MNYGARKEDWIHFDMELGLTADLLPVVSDPGVPISPRSKMKALGKTPSIVNGSGKAAGIPDWTERVSSEKDVDNWMTDARLGICIQTRRVRALDIDVDHDQAGEVAAAFEKALGLALPARTRVNSAKRLLAFELDGEWPKRRMRTAHGIVEFLGNGQQFVAAGTHPSGARYEWADGLPERFPRVNAKQFEKAWSALAERFAVETPNEGRLRKRGEDFEARDDVAAHLVEAGLVLDEGKDGQLFVDCPWKAGHSGDSGVTEAAWFPAGTGGFEQGHFVCLHASCAGRSDEDFREMVGCGTSSDFETVLGAVGDAEDTAGGMGDDVPAAVAALSAPPFSRDKQGRIEPTVNNVMTALESPEWFGADIALDEFRDEVVFSPHGKRQWRPIDDTDYTLMRRRMEQRGFKPVGPEITRSSVLAVARKRRFDSARDWLASLEWDGVERVGGFLANYFAAAPGDYATAVSTYWWTAHAARILYPGCRADMVPILVSPEGRWKSSALAQMVPALDQFVEIDLDHKDADLSRKMRGALLGELAELRGLSGRSAEANKAWVTRRFEEWTPKYVESKHRVMRRLVFAGTTNEDDFLDSSTGERRWLPIIVGEGDRAAIRRDRDQLWAEAREIVAERMADGSRSEEDAPAWEDAFELGKLARDAFIREDGWAAPVARWLQSWGSEVRAEGGERADFCTLEEIFLGALGLSPAKYKKADEQRMGKILRTRGFVRVRRQIGGERSWVWQLPALTCPDLP